MGSRLNTFSGKSNKAGGKSEEAMLSSVKSALDMVCQHLSDDLFDVVLRQTYEYASTTWGIMSFGSSMASARIVTWANDAEIKSLENMANKQGVRNIVTRERRMPVVKRWVCASVTKI